MCCDVRQGVLQCGTVMGTEVKSRSIRLDDENWTWLSGLPGRTSNDAIGALRVGAGNGADELRETLRRLVSAVGELPTSDEIRETLREVVSELKGQKAAQAVPSGSGLNPASVPGVSRGSRAKGTAGSGSKSGLCG